MNKKDIVDAWAWIRKNNQAIPDEVLDLMKDAAIEKLASHTPEVKKDWQIITVINKVSKAVLPYSEPFYTECWDIHSVYRLSDNSIWVVGDEIDHKDSLSVKRIDSFYITDKNEMACVCSNPNSRSNYFIENWTKPLQRTPLPSPDSLSKRILYLEERVDYIEKVLKIEG